MQKAQQAAELAAQQRAAAEQAARIAAEQQVAAEQAREQAIQQQLAAQQASEQAEAIERVNYLSLCLFIYYFLLSDVNKLK